MKPTDKIVSEILLPPPREKYSETVANNSVFIFGGRNENLIYNDLFCLNQKFQWNEIISSKYQIPFFFHWSLIY